MITSPTISPAARSKLTQATALLSAVGRDDDVPADVTLLCLAAADQLRTLDPGPVPTSVAIGSVATAIEQALRSLGELPAPVFALTAVLDAASHARRAHELAR